MRDDADQFTLRSRLYLASLVLVAIELFQADASGIRAPAGSMTSGNNDTLVLDGVAMIDAFPSDFVFFTFQRASLNSDVGVHLFDTRLQPLWELLLSLTTPHPTRSTPGVLVVSTVNDFALRLSQLGSRAMIYFTAHRLNASEPAYGFEGTGPRSQLLISLHAGD